MVVVVVEPVIPPGFNVQFPDGNPLKATLPVVVIQLGCVIESIIGALAVVGWASITTLAEAKEVQPEAFVTV